MRVKVGIKSACSHVLFASTKLWWKAGDRYQQVLPAALRRFSHSFTQALGIELLPDFRHLLADEEIKLDGFFNLLDGVNGSGVVFAAQLGRNTWKA